MLGGGCGRKGQKFQCGMGRCGMIQAHFFMYEIIKE